MHTINQYDSATQDAIHGASSDVLEVLGNEAYTALSEHIEELEDEDQCLRNQLTHYHQRAR
jgi:hypothetical protein